MNIKHYWKSLTAAFVLAAFLICVSFVLYQKDSASLLSLKQNDELSGGSATIFNNTINAFSLPAAGLSDQEELLFFTGNSFFNQNWVTAPASTKARDGIGPFFNARSCSGCHFKDGRGQPPTGISQLSQGLVIRLSIPGSGAHGQPLAEPRYGSQFHVNGINGVVSEGEFEMIWDELNGSFHDETPYSLRKAAINFRKLNYGEMSGEVLMSPRVATQMCGLGLLEAVSEQAILAMADENDKNGDGISGRPNYVWNSIDQKTQLGRFGWKANQPTILQQIAAALNGDMGITTEYFQNQNIESSELKYNNLPNGGEPEIQNEDLEKLLLYSSTLAVPARRNVADKNVLRGKRLFNKAGCNKCHVETLETGEHKKFSVLSNQTIHPYTDLLLHNMGEELADNRPDFEASGTEWRTPPLWGIGLFATVNKHTFYLHDGRARNLTEAILWHGGEAEKSKQNFLGMSKNEREQLIRFLESL